MKKNTILSVSLCFLFFKSLAFGAITTTNIYSIGDTFIKDNGKNENEGLTYHMRIQHPDRSSHVLLKFSQSDLQTAVGSKRIVSASLQLFLETNFNNWQSGSFVDVHRLTSDWNELGATWNCPNDTNLTNTAPDCAIQWAGGAFDATPSSSVFHQNNETGWKSFDVTGDVNAFIFGTTNFGWLLRKKLPTDFGSADFTSREGNATRIPRLVLTLDDAPPAPTFHLNNVAPYIVNADGTNKTIVLTGSNFTSNMQVFLDEGTIPFTYVNSTQVNISVNFTLSEMHYIEVRTADGSNSSFWEKGLFSVKPGEIVTNISTETIAPGAVINVYTSPPGFEEDGQIYFDSANALTMPSGPTGTMLIAVDPIYISQNEMEVTVPSGLQGATAIYADNNSFTDIYDDRAVDISSASEPGGTTSTCSVSSVNFVDQYGSWRKVSVSLSGCCSHTCNPQHFYSLQYYIDGQNQSIGCNDLAPKTSTAEWTFLPSGSHTMGARVVEFISQKIGNKRRRICTAFSSIKNTPAFQPQVGNGDGDSDSVSDAVENSFRSSYAPFYRLNLYEQSPPDGVPISLPVRIGPINLKKAAPKTDILMNYNALWTQDRGCPAGEGDHPYDTEPMGYLLQNGLKPNSTSGWNVARTVTIAHDGTPAENVDMTNGFQNEIFVAYNKHALFLGPCNYFCNQCDSNGTIASLSSHNVGNGPAYPGRCSHSEHWTTGNYLVPQKWTNVRRKFSSKYSSPFPAE